MAECHPQSVVADVDRPTFVQYLPLAGIIRTRIAKHRNVVVSRISGQSAVNGRNGLSELLWIGAAAALPAPPIAKSKTGFGLKVVGALRLIDLPGLSFVQ